MVLTYGPVQKPHIHNMKVTARMYNMGNACDSCVLLALLIGLWITVPDVITAAGARETQTWQTKAVAQDNDALRDIDLFAD